VAEKQRQTDMQASKERQTDTERERDKRQTDKDREREIQREEHSYVNRDDNQYHWNKHS